MKLLFSHVICGLLVFLCVGGCVTSERYLTPPNAFYLSEEIVVIEYSWAPVAGKSELPSESLMDDAGRIIASSIEDYYNQYSARVVAPTYSSPGYIQFNDRAFNRAWKAIVLLRPVSFGSYNRVQWVIRTVIPIQYSDGSHTAATFLNGWTRIVGPTRSIMLEKVATALSGTGWTVRR